MAKTTVTTAKGSLGIKAFATEDGCIWRLLERSKKTDLPTERIKMENNELGIIENEQALSARSDTQIYEAIRAALAEARTKVVAAVNTAMVGVYWEIGRQINEAVGERAEYGKKLLEYLSERLTAEFGKGFTIANLRNMRQFYQTFQNHYTLRSEFAIYELFNRII